MCIHLEIHYFRFRPQCRRFRPRSRLTSSSNSSFPVRYLIWKRVRFVAFTFCGECNACWPKIGSNFSNICGFWCGTKYSFHHQIIAVPQNIGLNLHIWYCMWEKEEFQLRHFYRAFINFGWKADSGKTTWMAPFCVFPSFCTAQHSFSSRILLFRSFLYFLDRVFGSLASVQTFFPWLGDMLRPLCFSL